MPELVLIVLSSDLKNILAESKFGSFELVGFYDFIKFA